MTKINLFLLVVFMTSCAVHPMSEQDNNYALGMKMLLQDRYGEAAGPLKLALAKDEKSPQVLYALGFTSMKQGKTEEALNYYSRCAVYAPAKSHFAVESLVGRGVVLHAMKQYHEAIKNYDQALHLSPNNTKVLFNRGCAYGELHDYPRAIDDFQHVLSLNPDDAEARYNRLYYKHAKCLAQKGEAFVQ
jgi:tetratricopeptide (TPR) repeat protein